MAGRLDPQSIARLRAYFDTRLEEYGNDPRGVDWQSAAAQQARFDALMAIGDLDGATVLDAGCGLGHFYGYLRQRGIAACYTGCDLSAPHIEAARAAYPEARFVVADAAEVLAREHFDYVIACGTLHLRVPHWQRWAWHLVCIMHRSARQGVAFTLPDRRAGHPPIVAAVEPAEWESRLRELDPHVETRYLAPWGDLVFCLRKSRQQDV